MNRPTETFSREKNVLGGLLAAYLAVRLASAVIPTWKKPVWNIPSIKPIIMLTLTYMTYL